MSPATVVGPLFRPDDEHEVLRVPGRLVAQLPAFEHRATLAILLFALARGTQKFGVPRPVDLSYSTLQEATGCSKTAITAGLREAVALGVLEPLHHRKGALTNYYRFRVAGDGQS